MTETAVISMAPLTAAFRWGDRLALLTSQKVLDKGGMEFTGLVTENRKRFVAFGKFLQAPDVTILLVDDIL